eukprot:m51a1_g12916 putative ras-related protein rab-2a (115) ;mRNA; r:2557-3007
MRGSHGAALVYDVTCRSSFAHRGAGAGCVVLLVGNKADREEERQVARDEGSALAEENGLLFMETSARTGASVEDSFVQLVATVYALQCGPKAPCPDAPVSLEMPSRSPVRLHCC